VRGQKTSGPLTDSSVACLKWRMVYGLILSPMGTKGDDCISNEKRIHTHCHTHNPYIVFTAGWSDGLKWGWLVKRWHMMNWRPLPAHLPSSSARLHHRQAWCHPASTTRSRERCRIFNQKAGHCYWMNRTCCSKQLSTISRDGRLNIGRFCVWFSLVVNILS